MVIHATAGELILDEEERSRVQLNSLHSARFVNDPPYTLNVKHQPSPKASTHCASNEPQL